MILVDTNLLVYARVRDFPQHEAAREWFDSQFSPAARVGLPWPSLLGFLRLVTNPRIFTTPERSAAAWHQIEQWLDRDGAWIPEPTERHRHIFASLVAQVPIGANLVPDAHLAALALEHGLQVASTDTDFARFPGLRWVNPIAPTEPAA